MTDPSQDIRAYIRDVRAGVEMCYSEEDAEVIAPLFASVERLFDWVDLLSKTLGQRQEIATADLIWQIRDVFGRPHG